MTDNEVSTVDYNQFTAKEVASLLVVLKHLEDSGQRKTSWERNAILRQLDDKHICPVAVLIKAAGYCDKTPVPTEPAKTMGDVLAGR